MKHAWSLFLCLMTFVHLGGFAEAGAKPEIDTRKVLNVPAEYKSIQRAIDAAPSYNAIIRVAPGIYSEAIKFKGKNICITSQKPEDPAVVASTVIDGTGNDYCVYFAGTEDRNAVLTGFTISGATSGGVRSVQGHANPVIRYNVICNNGGAKSCRAIFDVDGTIEYNDIFGNRGVDVVTGIQGCNGVIRFNSVRDNFGGKTGNGIAHSQALIAYNRIFNNSGESGRGLHDCGGSIQGNLVAANSGTSFGYGIRDCNGTIENNVICGNNGRGGGRGIWTCKGTIQNNTIYGNSHYGIQACPAVSIKNNILWGNGKEQITGGSTAPHYCCIQDWKGGGLGNISAYPLFVNPAAGDFRLQGSSPCIDAAPAGGSDKDFHEQSRPIDGDGRNGAQHDIGATEYSPIAIVPR